MYEIYVYWITYYITYLWIVMFQWYKCTCLKCINVIINIYILPQPHTRLYIKTNLNLNLCLKKQLNI